MTPLEPGDPSELSLEQLYCQEVGEQCALLTDSLRKYREDPTAPNVFDPLIRAGHTIKGGARVVGRPATARIAHALEALFLGAQRERLLTPETAGTILQAVDLLTRITAVDVAEAGRKERENEAEIEAVVAALQSSTAPSPGSAPPPVTHLRGPGPGDGESTTPNAGVGGRGKRVLVVEDSATVRELERDLLSAQGYLVDLAADGLEGWEAMRTSRYDLVVTDVEMPRLDGIALVRRIRGDERLRHTPVVIVSHKEGEADRLLGLDAGADRYLTKGSLQDKSFLRVVAALIS